MGNPVDSIPVVVHVKGVVHDIAGDHEGAKKAYLASSKKMGLNMGLNMWLDASSGAAAAAMTPSVEKQALESTSKTVAKQVAKTVAINRMVKSVTGAPLDPSRKRSKPLSDLGFDSYQLTFKTRIMPADTQTDLAIRSRPNGGQAGSGRKRERSASHSQSDSGFSQSSSQSSDSTMSEYILSSSDEEDSSDESVDDKGGLTDVKKGYIYFFPCAGGLYKVGMTKRRILDRLNEHRRKENRAHRPKQDEIIQVFVCVDVRLAETKILRIAVTTRINGTEYLRNNIEGVIKRVVAEVNSQQQSQLQISYYKFNGNSIVKV